MTLAEIRRHLAGEPYCFLPDQIRRLTRDEIFANYIRPRKRKTAKRDLTYREAFFFTGMVTNGWSWLRVEADWQDRKGPPK